MVCSYAEEQAQPTAAVLATRPPVHPATKKRSRKKSPHEIHATFTRAQQDSRLYNLKLDINDLKQQVRELAMHRELLLARSFIPRPNSDASVLRTVGRYFHGFTTGYRGLLEHAEQDAFVRSIVDEDFSLGLTGLGVDMLMEQWRRYTALFHVRETYLHSAEIITSMDDDSTFVLAKCAMDFRGVLTRAAVDMIFPNVQHDPALLLQALGREIAIPMLFHLYFNEDGRLVRHDAVADFFGAIGEALGGDICTAMRFTSDALVGQEAMLGPLSPVCAPESPMIDIVPLKKPRRVSSPNAAEDEIPFAEAEDEWAGQPSVVSPCTDDGTWDSDQVEVFDQGGCAWVDGSCDKSSSSNDSHRRLSVSFLLS